MVERPSHPPYRHHPVLQLSSHPSLVRQWKNLWEEHSQCGRLLKVFNLKVFLSSSASSSTPLITTLILHFKLPFLISTSTPHELVLVCPSKFHSLIAAPRCFTFICARAACSRDLLLAIGIVNSPCGALLCRLAGRQCG